MSTVWITPDELAERLRVSKRTVLDECRAGNWPGHKIGRQWRFSESDVLSIEAATVATPAVPVTRRRRRRSA